VHVVQGVLLRVVRGSKLVPGSDAPGLQVSESSDRVLTLGLYRSTMDSLASSMTSFACSSLVST
jgi:hypothetical protein